MLASRGRRDFLVRIGLVLGESKTRVPQELGLVRKGLLEKMMMMREESTVQVLAGSWRLATGAGQERSAGTGS